MKSALILACQRMDQKGWVANHDGNISVILDQDRILCTPTSRAKYSLQSDDLIEVNFKGEVLAGSGKPFSEFEIHRKIYEGTRLRKTPVCAVVHAHPPHATAAACAHQEILTSPIPEAVVSLGPGIPLAKESADFEALLPHYDAVLMAGNGVFAWGASLEQAFLRLELVEHLAHIFLLSLPLGGPRALAEEQVSHLLEKRKKAGLDLLADPARPHWNLLK